jgi:predicted AAA+ superfamily ATPase
MIKAAGHELFFYSRSDKNNRTNNMEIDFLIKRGRKISPVEVKSSAYRKHSSLDKFMDKFDSRLGEKFILYGKDYMEKDGVIHYPLYMAGLL